MSLDVPLSALGYLTAGALLLPILWSAYDIRLFAIKEFGPIIHEFDPWFNYRASEYLALNGRQAFFEWFDHMSWYPLGRPVGTTIYPGPQLASVGIWTTLGATSHSTMCSSAAPSPPHFSRRFNGMERGSQQINSIGGGAGGTTLQPTEGAGWSLTEVCCYVPAWFGAAAAGFVGLLAAVPPTPDPKSTCQPGVFV